VFINSLVIVTGYLLGSVPTGYILGRLAGVDVRTAGSGNVGATNVARVAGKRVGILTLIADTAKGLIPVIVARELEFSLLTVAAVGLAAFFGHLYPIFLKFRGGKGVATAFGVFLGLAPLATVILIVVFAIVMASARIVSLGSIATALASPVVLWFCDYSVILVGMATLIAALIIIRHSTNIQRLRAGTEPRFRSASSR
jgi:acyl phosphate:glycerol-3-phosphate acyltransferase